jgi:glyceraldehyde-3-phosphate dehydrogenase/erythrose-4-phosphate dehydrogenase
MRNFENTVLVVGTGTIGEPLIGLLSRLKKDLGIDEVLFHKRTPLDYEIAKVNSLVDQGASLVIDDGKQAAFRSFGHEPMDTFKNALQRSKVVIDCTPAGNKNKDDYYLGLDADSKDRTFIAQGSEKGFGVPYAHGINESVLTKSGDSRFIQVVSCNTHSISRIIKALNPSLDHGFISGDFVCIRRSNDASQNDGFTPSPTCGIHSDDEFGTHHARDVRDLLSTVAKDRWNLKSSAMKVNSQYMHVIRFSVELSDKNVKLFDVVGRFSEDKFVSTTRHKTANKVFSFGRDHGFYGRIYNQAVVCLPSLAVSNTRDGTNVTGFVFTPQDGNSLLSSISACLYGLHGPDYDKYLSHFHQFLKDKV